MSGGGVVAHFCNHLRPNLSQWKEGNPDSYLWLHVNRGAAPDLFVCVVYASPVGSKHKSKSLFQNSVAYIVEIQTQRGIILLGRDFNRRIVALPDTN